MIRQLSVTAAFAITGLLTACNDSPCTDTSVLAKVKELFDKQQFGQFIEAPPKVFVIQTKTATEVSTDKDSTKKRCSVLITTDIIEMMRFTKQASEEEIAKIKIDAPKKGFALTTDTLVSYVVQPLANGQNYVTVLP